ncbi:CPBP family glutamic-type intramembrane protease [Paenimyroides aestuarii]|uniref:CPBP family glutamic-type intramembrane protease n=1 Tax=Paenimyroides aestuarii TaxID=2968490 RepID=UPI0037CBE2C0
MVKFTLIDLWIFLKKPNDKQIQLGIREKVYFIFILFTIKIIVVFFFILPILYQINKLLNIADNNTIDIESYSTLRTFFGYVLIVPFIEEVIFRYFLRYKGIITSLTSQQKWQKNFPWIVYFSIILFAYIHIGNYTNNNLLFYILSPLIVSSQLIMGILVTFIRVRLSFFWGILYHSMWNFLILSIPESILS